MTGKPFQGKSLEMTIRPLTTDEVLTRMREIVARAGALQARVDLAASNAPSALEALDAAGASASLARGSATPGPSLNFQAILRDAVKGVSDAQNTAQTKAQAYQLGDDKVSLEDVMISLQKANLAMQGMVQVRNRLVEAYREVMNMQV